MLGVSLKRFRYRVFNTQFIYISPNRPKPFSSIITRFKSSNEKRKIPAEEFDMDPTTGHIQSRLLHTAGYVTYLTGYGIVVQTIAQKADQSVDKNNTRLGISLGAIVVNLAAYLWALILTDDIPNNHWKVNVFKIVFFFTGILSPYAAFSMLAPDWFTWYGFAIICTVITLYKCYNVLKYTSIRAYEKVVIATNYLIGKLLRLIWGDQSETNAAQAPPRASV